MTNQHPPQPHGLANATRLRPVLTELIRPNFYTTYALVATSRPTMIGRSTTCDVVVNHSTVSQEQAIVCYEDGQFWVRNISHKVPMMVSGHITLQYGEYAQINNNVILCFGQAELHLATVQPHFAAQQIECCQCHNVQDAALEDCMWCGISLAFGLVVNGARRPQPRLRVPATMQQL